MCRSQLQSPSCRRLSGALLIAGLALALHAPPASAFDPARTPAQPVPEARWGALEPRTILGDQTAFSYHNDPGPDQPFWFSLDVENGWVFAVTGRGLQVYDARTNGDAPELTAYGYAADTQRGDWCPQDGSPQKNGLMPCWNHSDEDWFLRDVDAPPDVDTVVAIAGREQGFSAWNTANKGALSVHYQDELISSTAVYSTTLGGTHYAFSSNGNGVYLYDLSAARGLSRCRQVTGQCTGVFKGKLPGVPGTEFIDGVGDFIILGRYGLGFQIWNVATPMSPALVMTASTWAYGVAMWKSGSSYYAASLSETEKLRTYDVSCIASGPCSVPNPLATVNVNGGTGPLPNLTFSSSNGNPFLYVGGSDTFTCKKQREYLFKVSNPAAPEDVTPQAHPDGYWGWYYEGCGDDVPGGPGFNWVDPRVGKFHGGNFYRAAYSLLDVHELAGAQPPVANFTWSPSDVYPGTAVSFSDSSTGNPNVWSWVFGGGDPGTSGLEDPTVTFATPGDKTITLQAFNPTADDTETKTLTVLDPAPVIPDYGGTPSPALVCQPVSFTIPVTGPGAIKGQPPLAYSWKVLDASNGVVAGPVSDDNTFTWNIIPATPPGSYRAEVTVTNGQPVPQQATKASQPVTVFGLADLPGDNGFTPTNDAFVAGTVQFHSSVPGATEWNWDFDGDGFIEADWTNDPVTGPNPVHTYSTTGIRQVRVKVRNCVNTAGATSAPLEINITQTTPLKAEFALAGGASCLGGDNFPCNAVVGTPVLFNDLSTGAEFWDYDWNGDGTFEDADNTAAETSHVYTVATSTSFKPRVRVRRGASEQDVFTLLQNLQVESAQPSSITIGGPNAGQPNATLSFSASATNCTPSSEGWTWNPAGGTLTGTGSSVTIKWTTTGSKSISVTNSACAGATGTKTVTIGSSPPPPPPPPPPPVGTLEAKFTFSPGAPKAGDTVTFNGTPSTGSPTNYTWNFGDGSPLASSATATATHAYPNAGSYQVTLSVVNTNKTCPPAPFCEHSTTQTVVVATGITPPVASYNTSATCTQEFSLVTCNVGAGQAVTFTDTSTGTVATRTWDFGDGQTATDAAVTHTFTAAGTYNVALTVGNGGGASSAMRTFVVAPPPPAKSRSIVLPWIAQTRGALVQSSDLYIHNPGDEALEVVVTFLRRGTPEVNPPQVPVTIPAHATMFYGDVIKELFDKENIAGFITVDPEGSGPSPIITSFNTTLQTDGSKFGQTIAGATIGTQQDASTDPVRHLVGLNATTDRLAYIGVSNPHDTPATYRLVFFNKLGAKVSESGDIVLARFGQQQFQPKQLQTQFGIANLDDYRVEVKTVSGGQLFPYGANVRVASTDPSFVGGGAADDAVVHLVGVFGTAGLNGSLWQTDVVLANSSSEVVIVDAVFRGVGVETPPTDTVHITLQPRETKRYENVLQSLWGLTSAVGVLTFDSDSQSSVFPTITGEIYDNANPNRRFGQSMRGRALDEAAGAGQSQHLIGLRQDGEYRATISLFNPSTEQALFDVIYRRLDGTPLQTMANVQLGPGRSRQLNPSHHPLPAAGVDDGFSVEIKVKAGKVVAGGQVVNNQTNDPAFIDGETR